MNSIHLLEQAHHLATRSRKKPKIVDLRRAQSATYYAIFHKFCFICAGSLLGVTNEAQKQKKWVRLYRKLGHAEVKKLCQDSSEINALSPTLIGPARLFVELQETRHKADYDPSYRPRKSSVLVDIEKV